MPPRVLKLIPKRLRLPIGLVIVSAGHTGLLFAETLNALVISLMTSIVLTSICLMVTQRHVPHAMATAVISTLVVAALRQFTASSSAWGSLLALSAAEFVVGFARQTIVHSPWGPLRATERMSGRLRRQSEQLQAAIQSQETTQRSVQQTVRQFESDRRALLEHLPVHVVQKDAQSRFTFVSKSFCNLVQRDYADIIGKTDHDLFPEEAARKFVEDDKHVMATGHVFNDVESTQLPSGTHSYMQVRKAPLLDDTGEVIGVQGIFWDVTEEYTSRQELQRIESLAHALINAALDAVLIVDANGRVLEANPASEKILGYTQDQVASHPLLGTIMHTTLEEPAGRSSDPPDTDTRYQRRTPISQILEAATGKRIEARLRRSNDDWFDAEISSHPLAVKQDRNWAIFIRDITNRKRAEKELRSAKEAAEHANAAKSEFIANVSHELRTPLTGIIGLHELLAGSDVNDRQRNYLELAKVSAANLLILIDDLLDFSKIEAGHIDIDEIPFSLVQCLEDTATAMAARAQLRGLELMLDLDPQLLDDVIGDPYRIRQILLNILGNAIKFTEKGEIRIRAERVSEATHTPNLTMVRFEVHDSGIGIPQEQRELIFEAFHQADSSTTRRYGGTGLGLTICRDLVEKMHGQIGVESARLASGDVVQGSCFYFQIPLKVPLTPATQTVSEPAAPAADVIVVASPCTWRDLLCRELSQLGFQVTTLSVDQLVARTPNRLFAAGNNSIVVADFRELNAQRIDSAPVVQKWILLTTLANSAAESTPAWLKYSDVRWLARPICRQALKQVLVEETLSAGTIGTPVSPSPLPRSAELLLVEDSPISQTVLQDMLHSLGHRVAVASTGRQAIEACREKQFDLVLMDIQMPDVDGFEATKEIRRQEQHNGQKQCIYALTAHATARDRAQCEAAGMDGFLVKPIPLEQLREAVQEATSGCEPPQFGNRLEEVDGKSPATDDASETAAAPATPPPTGLLLPEQAFRESPSWDELVKLMHGNESLLRDVLSLLAREAPRLGRVFQSSLQQEKLADARRAVHTLKSNVRYVGLVKIGDYAQRLEYLARDQQTAELLTHADNLHQLSEAIADWAEQQLKSNPNTEKQ